MKPASRSLFGPTNLTETLFHLYPAIESRLSDLWLPAPHQINEGMSFGVSLWKLDQALDGMDLTMALPASLMRAVRTRQLSFIGGRLCAERVAKALGYPSAVIGRTARGEPVWPSGLRGSITHIDGFAYSSAVRSNVCNGLGIDSEWVGGQDVLDSLLQTCLTVSEKDRWLGGERDPLIAILIFSAKEAGYKAIHERVGRFIDFTEFEVTELRQDVGLLVLTPVAGSKLDGVIEPLVVHFRVQAGEKPLVHTWCFVPGADVGRNP
ncbi:MAG TPA: 4'-phosphopantetheinyl transferase superfamily protein [Trinickia sp.]|nr:4'-phosphopantetheinyl transferase superfamily protein [Trinickia sp.]